MLTYGFYNSINNDRRYNAKQMSSLFDGIIKDGVFMSIGDKLNAVASGGMNITVGTGRAWFDHTWTDNDAPIVLTMDTSEVVLNRIDTIILEVNSDDAVRANSIKIVKGIPGSIPVSPTLTNTTLVHQYPLCDIYIGKGVTEITQSNITNRVGTTDCPYSTSIIEENIVRLDTSNKIPVAQIPNLDYIPNSTKGEPNGVPTLDDTRKIPISQIPSLGYIPSADKGKANGVPTLGADTKVPPSQLPIERVLLVDYTLPANSAQVDFSVSGAHGRYIIEYDTNADTETYTHLNIKLNDTIGNYQLWIGNNTGGGSYAGGGYSSNGYIYYGLGGCGSNGTIEISNINISGSGRSATYRETTIFGVRSPVYYAGTIYIPIDAPITKISLAAYSGLIKAGSKFKVYGVN